MPEGEVDGVGVSGESGESGESSESGESLDDGAGAADAASASVEGAIDDADAVTVWTIVVVTT